GGAAAQRSAPASAGKLAGLGPSAVCEVQAAVRAASESKARILIATLSFLPFTQVPLSPERSPGLGRVVLVSGQPRPRDPPPIRTLDELHRQHRAFLVPVVALALEPGHPLERGVAGERDLALD